MRPGSSLGMLNEAGLRSMGRALLATPVFTITSESCYTEVCAFRWLPARG